MIRVPRIIPKKITEKKKNITKETDTNQSKHPTI